MNTNKHEYKSLSSRANAREIVRCGLQDSSRAFGMTGEKKHSCLFVSIRGPKISGVLRLLLLATTLLLAAQAPVHAEEGVSPQAVLAVANTAGECDVLYSMVEFQKQTTIQGGNEYVSKFWAAESAKLGLTVEQLSDRCNKSVVAYDKLLGSAEEKPVNGNE